MSAHVHLTNGTSIALDAIKETRTTQRGVLLSLEGRIPGSVMNCAIIPLDRILAVISSLELVADQAAKQA